MEQPILHGQTPVEYFQQLVGDALARRNLRASNLTEYYLVNLLCQQVSAPGPAADEADEPLAVRLGRALACGGQEQRARLRRLADFTLFIAGYFPDSLNRKVVDVDYYQSIGEYAYGSLSQASAGTFAETYGELAARFTAFTDVLGDVSERALPGRPLDLLRAYETWLRTGSRRRAQQLMDRGLVPPVRPRRQYLQ
jgi:hypothetical protein